MKPETVTKKLQALPDVTVEVKESRSRHDGKLHYTEITATRGVMRLKVTVYAGLPDEQVLYRLKKGEWRNVDDAFTSTTAAIEQFDTLSDLEFKVTLTNASGVDEHPEISNVTLHEFAEANKDAPELVERARGLKVGEKFTDGGGAACLVTVERVA